MPLPGGKDSDDWIKFLLAVCDHGIDKMDWNKFASETDFYKSGQAARNAFNKLKLKYNQEQSSSTNTAAEDKKEVSTKQTDKSGSVDVPETPKKTNKRVRQAGASTSTPTTPDNGSPAPKKKKRATPYKRIAVGDDDTISAEEGECTD